MLCRATRSTRWLRFSWIRLHTFTRSHGAHSSSNTRASSIWKKCYLLHGVASETDLPKLEMGCRSTPAGRSCGVQLHMVLMDDRTLVQRMGSLTLWKTFCRTWKAWRFFWSLKMQKGIILQAISPDYAQVCGWIIRRMCHLKFILSNSCSNVYQKSEKPSA